MTEKHKGKISAEQLAAGFDFLSIHPSDDIAKAWRKSVFQAAVSILDENLIDWGCLHMPNLREVEFELLVDEGLHGDNPRWRVSLEELILDEAEGQCAEREAIAILEGIIAKLKKQLTESEN